MSKLESEAMPSVTVALRCFTYTELLWQHGKMSLHWHHGWVGVHFEWYHYPARPLNPPPKLIQQESETFLLYKPSYSQLCPSVNFSSPWQLEGSVGSQFEWHHDRPTSKTPSLVQESGNISYIGRIIADFVFKYSIVLLKENFTKSRSPLL